MDKLPPCPTPWCDHADTPYVWQDIDDNYVVVCGGSCGVVGPRKPTEEDAVEEWSARLSEECGAASDVSAPMTAQDKANLDNERGRGPVNCNHILRAKGKAYPRTCLRCRLGPCPFYQDDSPVPTECAQTPEHPS